MSNRGRSIGGTMTPYYPESAERESLKMLALMARRALNDRALPSEVDAAFAEWKRERERQNRGRS